MMRHEHESGIKTYVAALAQYHLSPEDKFENGRFLDKGITSRRHIVAKGVTLIRKEANQLHENCDTKPNCQAHLEFAK